MTIRDTAGNIVEQRRRGDATNLSPNPPRPPRRGDRRLSVKSKVLTAEFVAPDQTDKIAPSNEGDGKFAVEVVSGVSVLTAEHSYLYFRIDDGYMHNLQDHTLVVVSLTVLDREKQSINVEYDGYTSNPADPDEALGGDE